MNTTTTSTTINSSKSQPKPEEGWLCPRCQRINAPWVRQCNCSGWTEWSITSDKENIKPWWMYPGNISDITACADNVLKNTTTYSSNVNPQVGGSDYYDKRTNTYKNIPVDKTNVYSDKCEYTIEHMNTPRGGSSQQDE